jgi:hypothetical protein
MFDDAPHIADRMGSSVDLIFKLLGAATTGRIDPAEWRVMIAVEPDPGLPLRQWLIRLQVLTEAALLIGHEDIGLEGLDRLNGLGFMDVTWMDRCPLLQPLGNRKRFSVLRAEIGERAARVLAAFRSVASATP